MRWHSTCRVTSPSCTTGRRSFFAATELADGARDERIAGTTMRWLSVGINSALGPAQNISVMLVHTFCLILPLV